MVWLGYSAFARLVHVRIRRQAMRRVQPLCRAPTNVLGDLGDHSLQWKRAERWHGAGYPSAPNSGVQGRGQHTSADSEAGSR